MEVAENHSTTERRELGAMKEMASQERIKKPPAAYPTIDNQLIHDLLYRSSTHPIIER